MSEPNASPVRHSECTRTSVLFVGWAFSEVWAIRAMWSIPARLSLYACARKGPWRVGSSVSARRLTLRWG